MSKENSRFEVCPPTKDRNEFQEAGYHEFKFLATIAGYLEEVDSTGLRIGQINLYQCEYCNKILVE